MYYDRITTLFDIKRLPTGEVQCGHSHAGRYDFYEHTPRTAATAVFVEYRNDKASHLTAMCKRHAGTVRAGMTKGSWSFKGVEEVPVTVEAMALAPEQLLSSLTQERGIQRTTAAAKAKADALAYRRAGWEQARNDYYNSSELLAKSQPERTRLSDDDFGRVFVWVPSSRLTPKQARALADKLRTLASEAEVQTSIQERP